MGYILQNMIDNEPPQYLTDIEFLSLAKKIQEVNEDIGITQKICTAASAEKYIHEYCENLRIKWRRI